MTEKVINAYTIGDTVFSSKWQYTDGEKTWIDVRYAGYGADGSLYFHWRKGGRNSGQYSVPKLPLEMRVEIAPTRGENAVATFRAGPGENDIATKHYALGKHGELLEVEANEGEAEEPRAYGFRQ